MEWTNEELYNSVEPILQNYKSFKAQAELDKLNLKELFAKCTTTYDSQPHGTDVTNQTLSLVERREQIPLSAQKVEAIDIIHRSLNKNQQELCRLFYFEQETMSDVKREMQISNTKFYSLRNEVIMKFKDKLPWKTFT